MCEPNDDGYIISLIRVIGLQSSSIGLPSHAITHHHYKFDKHVIWPRLETLECHTLR